ncbi:MAG: hypothetical protein AB8I08_06430 [Sandaracinaceae bacterium]
MRPTGLRVLLMASLALSLLACEVRTRPSPIDANYPDGGPPWFDAGRPGRLDSGRDAFVPPIDVGPLDPDAACASAVVEAEAVRQPVDIIWVVDNSRSMQPAIEQVQAGLNNFAALLTAGDVDYRVIMLSLRGQGTTSVGGQQLFQVCIPAPLAGDDACADGERFFQVGVNIKSTQPLEQLLGTLGQTTGYLEGDEIGSGPWLDLLRPDATKTIVVVSDDNARMVESDGGGGWNATNSTCCSGSASDTADWFETRPNGPSEWSGTRSLPEGLLDPRWDGLFDGYTFSALYGWGSDTDPLVRCTYADGTTAPDAPGPTYTELVRRTGGVRAQICDGAAAWGPFFEDVATAVVENSRIDCNIPIPEAPGGAFFDRDRINVFLREGDVSARVGKVEDAEGCDATLGGWYYDDDANPTDVVLCPLTCEEAQPTDGTTGVDVQFGCQTLPI